MAKIRKQWVSREELLGVFSVSVAYTDVGGLTPTYIPFAGAAGFLTEDSDLVWDNAAKELEIGGDIIIANAGFIGSVGVPGAIQIEADGDIVLSQDLAVAGTLSGVGITDTGVAATNIAAGTTGERPGGIVGDIRYNSTLGEYELYIAAWHNLVRGGANVVLGTIGCGTITIADGSSLLLQEDITFGGATTENIIAIPDNLADAFSVKEGANFYQTFITTNGAELVAFGKSIVIPDAGYIGSVSDPDAIQIEADGDVVLTQDLSVLGTVGVGGAQGAAVCVTSQGDITSGAYQYGLFFDNIFSGTTQVNPLYAGGTVKASTTVGEWAGCRIDNPNLGAGAAITTLYGIYIANQTRGTTNYGLYVADGASSYFGNNLGIGQTTFGTNAQKVLAQATGVAPTTSPADCFQMYSADVGGAAGKAGAHFRDELGNIISLGYGGMLMTGTARVTKCFQFANAALGKGGTKPDEVIVGNYWGWSYDINDDSVFIIRLPDDWASGTDILIYVRWAINEAYVTNSGEVRWQATWAAHPADASEAIDDAGTTDDSGDINIPATAYHLTETLVETIPAASLAAGDEIGITIKRIALMGGNNPTADPIITCVGFSYISDKLGLPT